MNAPAPPPPERCALIGSGGHAGVVAAALRRLGIRLEAVFETDPARIGVRFHNVSIQPDDLRDDLQLHIALGDNAARRRIAGARPGARWLAVVHPSALVADDAAIGEGALIGMGAMVQTGARIGRHVIVNTGAIVEHDSVVGDFAHIAPGATLGGAVNVGEAALIGAGAVVLPGLCIGADATVGAGAVVTRSVAAGETVAGVPARAKGGEP